MKRKPFSFLHASRRQAMLVHQRSRRRFRAWPASARGMLWMVCGGLCFSVLNALARTLSQQLNVYEAQFLRYLMGAVAVLPWLWRDGLAAYRPVNISGQFWRGGVHALGLGLWFIALPHIPLADMTAIGFTGPIFIMLGAAWFLNETLRRDRWVAALIGFMGVLVVVWPNITATGGGYHLLMLASAPILAASYLISKALTRYEKTGVIVLWQSVTVTLFSLPMALWHWQSPDGWQWAGFALTGMLGSLGHYCWTRAFHAADISATQPLRFLELVWASLLGWWVFGDAPSASTWAGAFVILLATVWIARRENR